MNVNGQQYLDMAGNYWKWLKVTENEWKIPENKWKRLNMARNDWKLVIYC